MNPTRTALSSAVLPLRLTFADGYQLQASASVVGSNDLLTATHVLYQPRHGGWATGLAVLGTQMMSDGQVSLDGTATSISGWQVWANPQQVYADTDPTTLTLGESQYDVALIGVDRLLDQTGLTLTGNADAQQGSGLGYAGGQNLSRIDTGLQQGQDGYSVFGSTDSTLGPGSSGGPLLDGTGQIIGVNSSGTPGQATWWADIGPFLPQLTEQMQANDDLLQATGPFPAGPVQVSTGTTLPDLPATGQETVAPQVPNAVTVGGEFRVNSTTTNDQVSPVVISLTNGGYMVAWVSYGQDGSDAGIYAQRYASNGSAVGGEFRVNSNTANNQESPAISALADGGYVVTWTDRGVWNSTTSSYDPGQDGSGAGIYAQRYASNGSAVGGEFRVNSTTANDQDSPAITALADGGYVVTWTSLGQDGSLYGIYGQRYASNGSAVGGEFRVNSNTANNQESPAISALADGGYVVTWASFDQDGSSYGVYAQRYASNGSAVGGEFRVNSTTVGYQWYPAITALTDGGYVVTWQGSNGDGIYAQRYTSAGSAAGGEIHVNTSTSTYIESPEIAATNDGGYVVTWALGSKSGGAYNREIMAQRYASTGAPIGSEFRVNSTTTADQTNPDVAVLTNGNYLISWDSNHIGDTDIYAQQFSGSLGSVSIRALSALVAEGNGGGSTPLRFEISRSSSSSDANASVSWALGTSKNGNVAASGDFSGATSGSISFATGETSKQITLYANQDDVFEPDEAVIVQLSNPVNADLGTSSASTTLTNDDSLLSISAASAAVDEGSGGGATPVQFNIIRNNASASASVNWAFQPGTATVDDLNGSTNGSVTFNAGETSKSIILYVNRDDAQENDETFNVVLSSPSGASISTASAIQTIRNDDTPSFAIRADNASITEGSSGGTTPVSFDISRDNGNGSASVNWAFQPGTATADDLSGATSGTVYFNPGETSKTITLAINADTTVEPNETFNVVLSNASGAIIGTGSATQTIANDDIQGNLSIRATNSNVTEGSSGGTTPVSFDISRDNGNGSASVNWAFQPGTATADDLSGATSGTVYFNPGETSKQITLNINADTNVEQNETFSVVLSNASNGATIATGSATQTIVNDDSLGSLSISAVSSSVTEGSSGGTTPVSFTVSRSGTTGSSASVNWAVQHTTTDAADFNGPTSGSVSFNPGETSKTITLAINADTTVEQNETFNVVLSSPSNAQLDTTVATQTISNDDNPAGISIRASNSSVDEGSGGGTTPVSFDITRDNGNGSASVNWAFQPGTATADDLSGATSGSVSFNPGETSKQITLNINRDNMPESDEAFSVVLSNASSGAIIGTSSATQTIRDDDIDPGSTTVTIRSQTTSQLEGSGGGSTPMNFEIARTGVTTHSSSVDWAIQLGSQPGTADASDFSGPLSGSVSFAAGETSKSLQIAINRDNAYEPNETFSIALKNPVGAVIGTTSISASIQNDDAETLADGVLYRFAKLNGNYFYTANPEEIQYIQDNFLDMMRFEGYAFNSLKSGGLAVYRYALLDNGGGYFYTANAGERQYAVQHPETFRAEGVDGNGVQQPAFYAALDNDQSATPVYRLKNDKGGYLFTASEAEKQAAVSQYGYTLEQIAFKVPTAGTPNGFALAAGQDSQFAAEGTGTGGSLKYNVIRIGDTSGSASVQWSVHNGKGANPTEADDFVGITSGTLNFGANETIKTLTVQFNGDANHLSSGGNAESFTVDLSNPQGAQILVGSMAGKIIDDDLPSAKSGIGESAFNGDMLHAAQLHTEVSLIGIAHGEVGGL